MDVAVNSIGGKLILLHNTGRSGHWLEVSLAKFAPGALVTAVLPDGTRLVREVQAGSSYLSSEDPRAHFGLGKATQVKELDRPLAGRQGHTAARRRRRPDRHRRAERLATRADLQPARDRVERDGEQEDDPGDDVDDAGEYPAVLSPFETVASTSAPRNAPRTSPRPPKRLTPPITAAAIASSRSCAAAEREGDRVDVGGEDDAADRGHPARDHEDDRRGFAGR